MSHNAAVPTQYLYLQIGTNLNPISAAQKLFSQSLRSTCFEISALLMSATETWIEEAQVFAESST